MNRNLWIKRILGIAPAIILMVTSMVIPAPVSAAPQGTAVPQATAIPDKPPLPDTQSAPAQPTAAGDELWSPHFELGADDWAYAAVFAPNGDLYVGGDFHHIGGVSANFVAHWSASTNQWSALGSGVNSRVSALAYSGNTLYVGGYFNQAGGVPVSAIASYDVTTGTWSDMNGGMAHAVTGPDVYALAMDGSGNLIAAGQFDSAGGVTAQNIARWNGSAWSSIGGGIGTTDDSVEALAVTGSDIYAGGSFLAPNGYLAHFDGSTWTLVGGGTNGEVLALAISGTALYVGGSFTQVGGAVAANYVAVWNYGTATWLTLGSGLDGPDADAIAVAGNGNVYVAGRFTMAGGNPASRVAMWDGVSWHMLNAPSNPYEGVNSNGYGLAINGNDVIVTGGFTLAGGYAALHIARWNAADQQWYSPGNTVNGPVYAVATSGHDVFVGGDFTSAGGIAARSLAMWNSATDTWSTVGDGPLDGCNGAFCLGPLVFAIAIVKVDAYGPWVYVGGNFNTANGIAVNNIAFTHAGTWFQAGSGVAGCNPFLCTVAVYTLTPDNMGVDVGGEFNTANGVTVNNVAYFDGGVWHAFTDSGNTNTGTDGPVYAIANDGFGDYYFGGAFTAPRQYLVYFDGYDFFAGWSAPNASVRAIALLGNDVYIGGAFTNAAGSGADYIAVSKNGSDWQPLGSSLNGGVNALEVRGNTLFAAGAFTQSGALGLNYIAAWDPGALSWSNLGSGLDAEGYSLAASPYFIYAGGGFANAGGKPSQYLGRFGQYVLFLPVTLK